MGPYILWMAMLQVAAGADLAPLLSPGARVEKLATDMGFTEGPVWLPGDRRLVFSDIPASKLMQWTAAEGVTTFRGSEHANGNLLDLEGRLLSCQHGARNVIRYEVDGTVTVLAERFEGKRFNSPNDIAVSSDGSLWFTDPPWGLTDLTEGKELAGHWVFRLDVETGTVAAVIRDLVMPNGIAFSPDGSRLYVSDTGGHPSHPHAEYRERPATVSAYEVRGTGVLSATPVWRVETVCDGMCVDVLGNIYATGVKGVTVLAPDGETLGTIEVEEQPANVCFGGLDFKTLFITARTSLYSLDMRVRGSRPRGSKW